MTPEELAAIRETHRPNYFGTYCRSCVETVWPCIPGRLLAEVDAGEISRRANSQSARRLMDAIRDDPAFPPEDDPALFGDRALLVIERLRAEVDRLNRENDALCHDLVEARAELGDEL